MRINVVTEGTAELVAKLDGLDRKVATGFWYRFFVDAGKEIGNEFKVEARKRRLTGNMEKAGVGTKVQSASPNGGRARVRPRAPHWHLVEYGHRIVRPGPKRRKLNKPNLFKRRYSNRPGLGGRTQAFPMLKPAAKRSRPAVVRLFERQVEEVVRSV